MNAEAEKILGLANMLYVQGFTEHALDKLHECIKIAPSEGSAYHTLGIIYEEKGDVAKALDFYSIAAHVTKKDVELWLRVAEMAMGMDNKRHALYCLTRAIKASEGLLSDAERNLLRMNAAELYEEFGDKKQAITLYEAIIDCLSDADVMIDIAAVHFKCSNLCIECNLKPNAAKVLLAYTRKHATNVEWETMVYLIDLLSDLDWWGRVVEFVELARRVWEEKGNHTYKALKEFPLNCEAIKGRALIMLSGICKQHKTDEEAIAFEKMCLLKLRAGKMCTDLVMNSITDAKKANLKFPLPDLKTENVVRLAHAYQLHGHDQERAMELYRTVILYDEGRDTIAVWEKMAECARRMHGTAGAQQVYEEIVRTRKNNSAARVRLTEILYHDLKDENGAKAMLPSLKELESDRADEQVVFKAADMRRRLQDESEFLKLSLPRIKQVLDEALDIKSQVQKLRAEAKALQGKEEELKANDAHKQKKSKKRKKKYDEAEDDGEELNDQEEEGKVAKTIVVEETEEKAGQIVVYDGKKKKERVKSAEAAEAIRQQVARKNEEIEALTNSRDAAHSFSHPAQFAVIVQVIHALLLDGAMKEARSIIDKIGSLSFPRGLSKEQTVTIRYLRTKYAQLEGSLSGMAEQANKIVTSYPDVVEMWDIVLHDGSRNTANAKKVLLTAKKAIKMFAFAGNEFNTNYDRTVNEKVPSLLASSYVHGWNDQWAMANIHSREALRLAPDEPSVRLSMACSQIHSSVKTHLELSDSEKNARVLRAMCQLNTMAKQRNDVSPLEATYNAARALHQVNLMFLAQPLYERCLEIKDELVKQEKDIPANVDVSGEAAYNLSMIYRASGCDDLARALLKKYI
jgi:general transcription factor 3C polypeptide 3 (transcription factor C subunit 4)